MFKDYSVITSQLDSTGEGSLSLYFAPRPDGRKPTKYAKRGWTPEFYRLLQDNFKSDARIHKLPEGRNSLMDIKPAPPGKREPKSMIKREAPLPGADDSSAAGAAPTAAKKVKSVTKNTRLQEYISVRSGIKIHKLIQCV